MAETGVVLYTVDAEPHKAGLKARTALTGSTTSSKT
jgi:hypothetical protein